MKINDNHLKKGSNPPVRGFKQAINADANAALIGSSSKTLDLLIAIKINVILRLTFH